MTTFMQWVHLMAAVVGLGGMGFLLLILIPSLGVLSAEQREALSKAVAGRFRWASWSAMTLLLISGLYNIRRYYWEEPWDRAWKFLALKIAPVIRPLRYCPGTHHPLQIVRTSAGPPADVAPRGLHSGGRCGPDFRLPAARLIAAAVTSRQFRRDPVAVFRLPIPTCVWKTASLKEPRWFSIFFCSMVMA